MECVLCVCPGCSRWIWSVTHGLKVVVVAGGVSSAGWSNCWLGGNTGSSLAKASIRSAEERAAILYKGSLTFDLHTRIIQTSLRTAGRSYGTVKSKLLQPLPPESELINLLLQYQS